MDPNNMHKIYDAFEDLYAEMPPDNIGVITQHPQPASNLNVVDSDSRRNSGDSSSNGSEVIPAGDFGHRTPEDDWVTVERDADYLGSDHGVRVDQVDTQPCRQWHAKHVDRGDVSISELVAFLQHSLTTIVTTKPGIIPDEYLCATSAPASPSSTYPEPSSGERSLGGSEFLPPWYENPTVLLAHMGQEPLFQSTPGYHFITAPMWLTPEPPPLSNSILGLNPYWQENDSDDDSA